MTKYVISGYIGFDNFGDEAIASILINHLKNNNAEKITVLSLNPVKTSEQYGVNSCKFLHFVKPIMEADVLISGGGSLLQDITSLKSLLYYLSVIMTAIVLNKKVFIFAQGFSPFRTKIGEFLTKFVLKFCDKITVRDIQSQTYLNSIGIASELVSDPVFGMDIPKNTAHKGVGIQLRNFSGMNENFMINLADIIVENFKNEEIKLFSLHDTLDLTIIEKFAGLLSKRGCKVRIHKSLSVAEAIQELSKLEFLIGMRFHACLVCTKAGVKVLGINYDKKVKTLSENVGFPSVNPIGCELKTGLEKLFNTNPENYCIPSFKFPDIIL